MLFAFTSAFDLQRNKKIVHFQDCGDFDFLPFTVVSTKQFLFTKRKTALAGHVDNYVLTFFSVFACQWFSC